MLISFNWLKNYVNLPDSISPEEVAEKLKMSTVEVEGIDNQGKYLENIVVGKIVSCEKHPNADKLKVCSVDVGNEKLVIVCGGSNVSAGMLVAVAKTGAKVKWHGEGELVELKPTVIRGVESNGMICASDEIGLGEMFPKKEEKEIIDLGSVILSRSEGSLSSAKRDSSVAATLSQNDNAAGKPLAEVLGLTDVVFEIDNKSLSNRPDLWGHYGLAREVAALFNRELVPYKTKAIKSGKDIKLTVSVEDKKLCPRYLAVAVSGVKVGESPEWLKQKLLAVGLRPINNIVDITNFVMMDLGQPMHAFDAHRVENPPPPRGGVPLRRENQKRIIVRRARDGEKFIALDKKEYTLTSEMLVIANEEKALALAGVMGGLESGVAGDTETIIFESANFEAASIRKTSTKLGLRTDSSARFEKSLDPTQCKRALEKAIELTLQLCPNAKVASAVVDESDFALAVSAIELSPEFFKKKLGVEIPEKIIISILEKLGFEIKKKKAGWVVKIPSWRATKDISIAEDIVEEVARVYGYDKIPAGLPVFPIAPPEFNRERQFTRLSADTLVSELGYTEVYNYSFVSEAQITRLGSDSAKYIQLDNPLSAEKPFLRRSLLPNLLENIKANIDSRQGLKIFEIGKVFIAGEGGPRAEVNGDELLPNQGLRLMACFVEKKSAAPFWEARRAAENIGAALGLRVSFVAESEGHQWQHPARRADLKCGDTIIGCVCELHPGVAAAFGIEERVGIVELNLSAAAALSGACFAPTIYALMSIYPEVTRDLAFIVKKETTHAEITKALSEIDPLIKKIELFDVFEGRVPSPRGRGQGEGSPSGITAGYKSVAYHLMYADPAKTLVSAEVDAAHKKVETMLVKKFGAEMRK